MCPSDFECDIQSETNAIDLPVVGGVCAIETFEDFFGCFIGYRIAGVGDSERCMVVDALELNMNCPVWPVILNRITNEVCHELVEEGRISVESDAGGKRRFKGQVWGKEFGIFEKSFEKLTLVEIAFY